MSANKSSKIQLGVESLEGRDLPAVNLVWMSGTTWYALTDLASTNIEVRKVGSNLQIKDTGNGTTWVQRASTVSKVELVGQDGNDRFTNLVSNLPTRMVGGRGNDTLIGNNAVDELEGGEGSDTLQGKGGNDILSGNEGGDTINGGNGRDDISGGDGADVLEGDGGDDTIKGGQGDDTLRGGDGNDVMFGYDGDDQLQGGAGHDDMHGDNGNDVLRGGNGNDHLFGGDDDDTLIGQGGVDWSYGDNGRDTLVCIDGATGDISDGGGSQDTYWADQVGVLYDMLSDAGDIVHRVSRFANGADRSLDGDRLADPRVRSGSGHVYKRFDNVPLYSSENYLQLEINQGNLGDSGLLAALGQSANGMINNIVDFQDGTYGVKLGSRYFRVDNDLAVANASSNIPVYADITHLSAHNPFMWVAISEKAYAFYRSSGTASYDNVVGETTANAFRAFGYTPTTMRMLQLLSPDVLSATINSLFGHQLTITIGAARTGELRANHAYQIDWASTSNGTIGLFDPYGIDGTGSTPSNGEVFVTAEELFSCIDGVLTWVL